MPVFHTEPPPPPKAASVTVRFSPPVPICGAVVQLTAAFSYADKPHDPPGVKMQFRSPEGRVEVLVTMHADEYPGIYYGSLRLPSPGQWPWRVEGENGEGVAEGELRVLPSGF